MIPGRSNNWILHPLWYRFPGMAVSVVNSYPAASDLVSVSLERREDLPTLGKPMRDTRPSPDRATSNPRLPSPIAPPPPPPPPPPLLPLLSSCRGCGVCCRECTDGAWVEERDERVRWSSDNKRQHAAVKT